MHAVAPVEEPQEPLPDYGNDDKSELSQALKDNTAMLKDMKAMFQVG